MAAMTLARNGLRGVTVFTQMPQKRGSSWFPPTQRRAGTTRMASALAILIAMTVFAGAAHAQCRKNGTYDPHEIANSAFFSTREQTKFARSERNYPLPSGASARYCFSRGCAGQLTVLWTEQEQYELLQLRTAIVENEDPSSELQFIKAATLQMEAWLYRRLRDLRSGTVNEIMREISGRFGPSHSVDMTWVTSAMISYGRFDKECATYAMEATQHLLVLANLGLIQHWNVMAPIYQNQSHWTAGLENRDTCETYRFDLNFRASARHDLHVRGQNPADLALQNPQRYSDLFPAIDRNGSY